MPIACVGINHRTAPVGVRERLTFSAREQQALLERLDLDSLQRETGIAELAILSTCNRTEVYAAHDAPGVGFPDAPRALVRLLAAARGLSAIELRPHRYTHAGSAAVRHLCRVAAGLDSMVLGESEILGQVGAAHATAAAAGAAGPLLEAAFQSAVRAGRRSRSETPIARTPVSVSSEAVRLACEVTGDLAGRRIVLVGTGKMGRLAGESLHAHGATDLAVVSRTAQHAEALAAELGGTPLAWHSLEEAVRGADLVFCSTGAPHAVITRELVASASLGRRPGRPLVFVDIAVPRDVEAGVAALPEVRVYDLDHLQERIDGNLATRARAVPGVERIIEQEVVRFEEWCRALELRPVLAAMRARGEAIRRRELERMLRRLGDASPQLREQLERFSASLVSKLLHEPTSRLRRATEPARRDAYVAVVRDLFGLEARAALVEAPDTAA